MPESERRPSWRDVFSKDSKPQQSEADPAVKGRRRSSFRDIFSKDSKPGQSETEPVVKERRSSWRDVFAPHKTESDSVVKDHRPSLRDKFTKDPAKKEEEAETNARIMAKALEMDDDPAAEERTAARADPGLVGDPAERNRAHVSQGLGIPAWSQV